MLQRKFRLRDRRSVARVYRSGKTFRAGPLALRAAPNGLGESRFAVVVSKKVAKSAPVRNRIRRRLFETIRHKWPSIAPGFDAIISVYEESLKQRPKEELDQLVDQLLDRAGMSK